LLSLALVACSSGGSASLSQRCTSLCMRNDRLCMLTTDCTAQCSDGSVAIRACGSELDTMLVCLDGQPDANFCTTGVNNCATSVVTYQNCLSAHTSDAGGGDAGP
jgi:hypothetical protein